MNDVAVEIWSGIKEGNTGRHLADMVERRSSRANNVITVTKNVGKGQHALESQQQRRRVINRGTSSEHKQIIEMRSEEERHRQHRGEEQRQKGEAINKKKRRGQHSRSE
eukprot:TRINITY_DN13802_c0_g1_i1.p1 TRINITY_DN13802_c0_g1~~TRINITY_DN13802_c0_g1_i1.p1  ORF type:complete len:109 (+),score=21.06 TRINITY_DN13802_c0_g1_i1:193-519(+)